MVDSQILKFIHILSATVLFGTGIGSAFYFFVANRTKNIHAQNFASRFVVLADWLFTTPAVIIQLITGVLLVKYGGYSFSDKWIIIALILFFLTGVFWVPVVFIQIKMRNLVKIAIDSNSALPPRYWYYEKLWIMLGTLAFPTVIVILYLMVFKPF